MVSILEGSDAVINLIGENISGQRWSPVVKKRILESRLRAGNALVTACRVLEKKPEVCIQASATGYYGTWEDVESAPLCGEDMPSGTSFLAEVARRWEDSTAALEDMGVRRCIIRTAPVLGPGGGVLARLSPWFKVYLGGFVGRGNQPFPWIHIEDEVAAMLFLLDTSGLNGAFNLVSPDLRSMDMFISTLAMTLNRPVFFRIPSFLLRFGLGEMAQEVLLTGQKAVPLKLEEHGFVFSYPTLETALESIFR